MNLKAPTATLAWFVRRWPRGCFAIARLLDAVSHRLDRRRHPWYCRILVMRAAHWLPRRRWPFPCAVLGQDPASLHPPMIIVSLHVGIAQALTLLLEQLPGHVLILQYPTSTLPAVDGIERFAIGGEESRRIAAAKRALDVLRNGGYVFLFVDQWGKTAKTPMTLFGQPVSVSSGAFWLARMTGAPIVPVVARWRRRRIEIELGELIAADEESAMAARLAHWIDEQFPGEGVRSKLVRQLTD